MQRFHILIARVGLLVALLFAVVSSRADESCRQDERVRATEPTIITVHEATELVRVDVPPAERPEKAKSRRRGLKKAFSGAAGLPGWMLNSGDVIPSIRERRDQALLLRR